MRPFREAACNEANGFNGAYDGAVVERDDAHCGPRYEYAVCNPNRCCSSSDFCGDLDETHCAAARGYDGAFDGPILEGDDARCGPNHNNAVCRVNRCCSTADYCGDLDEIHCAESRGYDGAYDGKVVGRDDARCGPDFDGAVCNPGRCRSTSDYCGGMDETHCTSARGYEGAYDGESVP